MDASLAAFTDYSQLTLSHSGNSTQVGLNVNGGGGDRKGFNLSLNYDIQQGMASGGIGYTMSDESNPFNKMGINLNFDRYGMTSTAQYDGVNLASMGPAGFSMQEIDWAMLNINEAQDRQKFLKDKAYIDDLNKKLISEYKPPIVIPDSEVENFADNERAKERLIASKTETPESLKGLNPKEIAAKLEALQQKQNAENTAAGAAATGSLAFMLLGYLGLGRKENDGDAALEVLDIPNNEILAGGASVIPWYSSGEYTVNGEYNRSGGNSKTKELVDGMPSELRKAIEKKYQGDLAIRTLSEAVKKYSSQKNALETELNGITGIAAKAKGKFIENAGASKNIQDTITSLNAYVEGYARLVEAGQLTKDAAKKLIKEKTEATWKEINSVDKNVATSVYIKTFNEMEKSILPNGIDLKNLTPAERKVMVFGENQHQLLFDKLPTKERNAAEQKLALAGLKPPTIDASTPADVANQLRVSYEKLVVKMAIEERKVAPLTKELNDATKKLNTEKSKIQKEVSSSMNTIVAREQRLFEVKISVVDPASG
ncbi:hypothetical protein JWG40_10045 [Leptospira sp. 201903074]|uniref:hypothetical protein n=1 Tax=Leptospira abararensis TaxID=2810036 RepID=UPI0019622D1D|nr:hypothetical protein [Leptospira abararensis]MBM9547358.1 hypothetical protein [Leptospira abararensis]